MSDYTKEIAEKREQIQQIIAEINRLEQTGIRLQGHLDCYLELQKKSNPVEENASSLDTQILTSAKEQVECE